MIKLLKVNRKINEIGVIISTYLLLISAFFVFRLLLFFIELDRLESSTSLLNIVKAFVMGVRFDIVIIGYIMFLPAVLLLLQYIFKKRIKLINTIIFYWTWILFSIAFMISAADIPYFGHFFSRFTVGAFEWMDHFSFVFKMIVEEPKYLIAILPFLLIAYLYYRLLKLIFKSYSRFITKYEEIKSLLGIRVVISLVLLLFMFIGIRGRVQKKSPIRVGTAYFCDNQFLNQLGLNPVFTFMRSYLDDKKSDNQSIALMDNKEAVERVRSYLNVVDSGYKSPIARNCIPDSVSINSPNIVLVIMESMSAAKMERYGNHDKLTPFLDSLTHCSYYFNNYYTAGIHTYNGIFSSLYSYPALYHQHPLKQISSYTGMPHAFKKIGYSTTYFTTHDSQFDNVEGFLRANAFDNVVSESDYPSKEVKTTLGVPDDYMFRYSIPYINKLSQKASPFFVALMTTSDHPPYYIPEYFKPHSPEIKKQVTEYADWSLRRFIQLASQTEWFDNTIFVFTADHGAALNVCYPIALNYNHSPFLIYSPKLLKAKQFDQIAGQIDIFPTIMGLIQKPYLNNTLGVDLINEGRPYAIINGDDKMATLDNKFLFILTKSEEKSLYLYSEKSKVNVINEYPEKANEMELYLRSHLQTYQMLLNENMTSVIDNSKKSLNNFLLIK